jgi:Fuc2NAc and GlcNAc transferase
VLISVAGALAAAVATWLLTGLIRRHSLRQSVLDIPNERSLHDRPTPLGGGLGIVAATVAGVTVAAAAGRVSWPIALALAGGLPVAAIGWLDDRRGVSPKLRAAVHATAAAWGLVWLGGLPSLDLGGGRLVLDGLGAVLAGLWIVWATNFFNFMDGIDGLAGAEAATVGGFAALLLHLAGQPGLASVAAVVAGASVGFLGWNWAPARIFMGDAGSGFLGFSFGTLAVASERVHALPLLGWMLLLGVFVFDATVTLVRRAGRGERWHEAHRRHAYQRLVQSGVTHARVASAVVLVNFGLGGLATMALWWPDSLPIGLLAGALGLTVLYVAVEHRRPMFTERSRRRPED